MLSRLKHLSLEVSISNTIKKWGGVQWEGSLPRALYVLGPGIAVDCLKTPFKQVTML